MKRKMTKSLTWLLTAALVAGSSLPVLAADVSAGSGWDGETKTEPQLVNGTYQIGTAEELAWYADFVNSAGEGYAAYNVILTGDIDLNDQEFTPIGNWNSSFYTTFDGADHTISGLKITDTTEGLSGIFGYVADADIKNLTVSGEIVSNSNDEMVGGIIGYATDATTIDHCVSNVNITTNSASNITRGSYGGVVGSALGSGESALVISDCVYNGTLTCSAAYAGGIAGDTMASSVINCINNGAISSTKQCGGIVGNYSVGSNVTDAQLKGNFNHGDITGTGGNYVGGLVGLVNFPGYNPAGTHEGYVRDCGNTGNISGGTGSYVGGAFGRVAQNGKITDIYNTGKVSASGDYVGGLAGQFVYNANGTTKITISGAYNAGTLDCGETQAEHVGLVAGEMGAVADHTCYIAREGFKAFGQEASEGSVVQPVTEEQLKALESTELLGEGFVRDALEDNDGYPVLKSLYESFIEEARPVDALISALGAPEDIALEDEEAVSAARAAYEALSDEAKAFVEQLAALEAAEARIRELKDGAANAVVSIEKGKIASIAGQIYAGKAVTPKVTVTVDGRTLAEGTDYTAAYRNNNAIGTATVTVTGKGGYEGTLTKTFTISPAQTTGVKFSAAKATSLKVNWSKVAGAEGYQIYRAASRNGEYKKVKTVKDGSAKSWTNSGLGKGKTYYYKVRAYKKSGDSTYHGDYSSVITATTLPAVPSSVKAGARTTASLKITWGKVSNAAGYRIYRSTSKNGTFKKVKTIKDGSVKTWKDTGLTAGKTYYYKVKAYKKLEGTNYWGSASGAKRGTTQPKAPSLAVKSGKAKTAALSWKKVSNASGYVIYRAASKNGTYKKVKTISKASTVKYTNSGLGKGKTWYYKIRSYKTVGGVKICSAYSKAQKVTVK